MEKKNTFQNLEKLKKIQVDVKNELGKKYEEIVSPYVIIIELVMKANEENEFEALKRIKYTLPIYKKPDAPMFFTSALIEITESKHFQKFKN